MVIIKAREITNAHIGRAVHTERDLFVLDGFTAVIINPNLHTNDPGRINLRDLRGRYHSVYPDDPIEVES